MPLNDDISAILRILARYLCDHPQACDTLPGIEHWWLEPHMNVRRRDLTHALLWLERQGLVQHATATDRRVRYSRVDHAPAFEARVLALLASLRA